MTSTKDNPKRVLAIDPTSRGFGFAVFESPTTLIERGVRSIREKQDREKRMLGKVLELIRHYQPDVLVLDNYKKTHRNPNVKSLLSAMSDLAVAERLKSCRLSIAQVKRVFKTFGATTKQEIAQVIAQQLPELASLLPRYRKSWLSEHYQMAMFDAAALALTYFYSRPVRSDDAQERGEA